MLTRSGEQPHLSFSLYSCSSLQQLWLPQTEKDSSITHIHNLSPWLLITLTKSQRVSLLYSQLFLLLVMMSISANSNQLIFYSTCFLICCGCFIKRRMQSHNTGLVIFSSSSSPPFILLRCKQTAGFCFCFLFFFCKSYHYSSLQAQELLQIADGSLSSQLRTRDEITLGIWSQGWSGVDGF